MASIALSRKELSSLEKIIERPRLATDIPHEHMEKFVHHGLVKKDMLLVHVTALGQVEMFRQRFKAAHQ